MREIIVAALVAVTLAGCAGNDPSPSEDVFGEFGDVDVDGAVGVIRGVVVDPTVAPVAGVLVKVLNTGFNATTNENGAFLIAGVAAGLHFLEVSKDGYETVQASADVQAAVKDPAPIRVQITRLPGSDPRFVPLSWEGYIGCTYRRWEPPSGGYGTACPEAGTIWPEHDATNDHELEQVPTYVTSDLVWKSTQRLGGEMSFNLRRTDGNCDTVDIEGVNPLHLSMGASDIALHTDRCSSQGGFGPDMPLRIAIFTAHLQETEPPTGGWGFGLQLEQDFQVFTHIFYNYEPPADWRFTDDAEVPQPGP